MRTPNWHKYIVVDPDVLGGAPIIKGTRVPVQVVIGSLAGGMSIAEVCEQYRLTPEHVQAALVYTANVLRSRNRTRR